jgi:hypothetical protein
VVALLVTYFSYQWWFNPSRAIKRQLGELAATLSVPAEGSDVDRLARLARLARFFAPDVSVRLGRSGPVVSGREALVGAVAAWKPPAGGWHVEFVDVQVTLESETTARSVFTVQVTTRDAQTGQLAIDAREAAVEMAREDGVWVITAAEPVETLQRP